MLLTNWLNESQIIHCFILAGLRLYFAEIESSSLVVVIRSELPPGDNGNLEQAAGSDAFRYQ